MTAKPAVEELDLIETGGPPADNGGLLGYGDDGGDFRPATPRSPQVYVTGIWIALASILMFFMGLTSSFIVRKGLGADWAPFTLPPLLWANSLVLLVSSGALELSRRAFRDPDASGRSVFRRWWHVTTALGLVFLIGQFVAWQQLRAAGVYLASNPSSSFFYLMTATHGLHLAGGILALAYVAARSRRAELVPWPAERAAVTATATYWHFLGGLWIFLFLLLWLGR
ncbi:MAG TPA: cytochrome c oxidase subunit 3 [Candidatus Acidoferrales bacterium]